MSKYKSSFSVDYRTPVFIDSNDPRAQKGNFEKNYTRHGRDIEIVESKQKTSLNKYKQKTKKIVAWGKAKDPFDNTEYAAYIYSDDGINWSTPFFEDQYGTLFNYSTAVFAYDRFFVFESSLVDSLTKRYYYSIPTQETDYYLDLSFEEYALPNVEFNSYVRDAVYGNKKIIVFSQSKIFCSTDGLNWTIGNSVNNFNKLSYSNYSSCYGKGKYISSNYSHGSNTNKYLYSSNGIDWSMGIFPSNSYNDKPIAYGGGLFVVLNEGNYIYSENGIDWTTASLPVSHNWKYMYYSIGRFIGVDPFSNTIVIGTVDKKLINWETSTLPTIDEAFPKWSAISYVNKMFVVTATYGGFVDNTYINYLAHSKDGLEWTLISLPEGSWTLLSSIEDKY